MRKIHKIAKQLSIKPTNLFRKHCETKISNLKKLIDWPSLKLKTLKDNCAFFCSKKWVLDMNLFSPIKNLLLVKNLSPTKPMVTFAKIKHYDCLKLNKYSIVQTRQFSSNPHDPHPPFNEKFIFAIIIGIMIGIFIFVAGVQNVFIIYPSIIAAIILFFII